MAGLFQLEFHIDNKMSGYKSILNKLKTFMQYMATVGIHSAEGQKKVIRRYTSMSKGTTHNAGKSYRMNIVKLAYQNEFGANITIRPRYITRNRTVGKNTVHTLKTRQTFKTIEKYSALRKAKQQGYLLLNKQGKFVAYFKPNSVIHIPARPFIKKVITNKNTALTNNINDVLNHTFIKGGYSVSSAIRKIAQLVQVEIINNIRHNGRFNHPLTVKAKGKNDPLVDEQDRLSKAIKFKIYKGVKGMEAYRIQRNIKFIDKALKTIEQFNDKGIISNETKIGKVFTYKGFNPNFEFRDYYGY